MATIITKEIENIFDTFLEKTIAKLTTLYKDTNMEDEAFATISGAAITSAMNSSVNAHDSLKRGQLIDKQIATEAKKTLDIVSLTAVRDAQSDKDLLVKQEQIDMSVLQQDTEVKKALDIASSTAVRDAQSDKDLLVKQEQIDMSVLQQDTEVKKALDIASSTAVRDAQSKEAALNKIVERSVLNQKELSEKIKNGIVSIEYTYTDSLGVVNKTNDYTIAVVNAIGTITSAITTSNTAPSIYQQQAEKIAKDTLFVEEQTKQLGYSVIYNNRLKTLENYSDTIGNLGIGGFVVSASMWTTYFDMINRNYSSIVGTYSPSDDATFAVSATILDKA